MPGLPSLADPLSDGVVALRDFAPRDIPEILIAYEDDREMHLRVGQERPPSGAELGRWAENDPADRLAGDHATLTVLEHGRDLCQGQINVHHLDWDHARAEVGLWLAPGLRGRGLGRRALRLAATWLLEAGGLARVQLLTEPDNTPMLRAAAACGFVSEGVLHGYYRVGRHRGDAAILSRLASDR